MNIDYNSIITLVVSLLAAIYSGTRHFKLKNGGYIYCPECSTIYLSKCPTCGSKRKS